MKSSYSDWSIVHISTSERLQLLVYEVENSFISHQGWSKHNEKQNQ